MVSTGRVFAFARRNGHVDVDGIGGDAVDRASLAPEISADDADVGAVVVGDFGNFGGLHFLIARRGHFLRRGKIGPELEAVHAASRIALGHFLVNDAAAGGHPLHVAGGDGAVVAHAVAVLDGSGEDVGDGLDAAVRMPGKSGKVVLGNVVAEIVEQQEGIEVMVLPKPKARRRWTPAPSRVGLDLMRRFTGRMDMEISGYRGSRMTSARSTPSRMEL